MPDSANRTPIHLTMDRLELRFVPLGDRYAHVVGWLDGEQFTPLFESIEAGDDADWPASPPLQEVHIEHREGGQPLALCVGMAGKSHWSLSVELRSAEKLMLFDVACRIKQPLPQEQPANEFPLGSGYQAHTPVEETARGSVQFQVGEHQFALSVEAPEQGSAGKLTMGFDSWRIEPTGWVEGPLPRTLRWRYALRQLA